jgi:hypothetical protein
MNPPSTFLNFIAPSEMHLHRLRIAMDELKKSEISAAQLGLPGLYDDRRAILNAHARLREAVNYSHLARGDTGAIRQLGKLLYLVSLSGPLSGG